MINKKLLAIIEKKMFDLANIIDDERLRADGIYFTEQGIEHLIENIMEELENEYTR